MKALFGFAAVICLFVIGGCSPNSPDAIMQKQLSLMNEVVDAMEKGDEAKMESLKKEGEALEEKLKAMNLSPEEKAKLMEKYKPEMEKLMARMMAAAFKNLGNKAGNPFGPMK